MNREEWLELAMRELAPLIAEHGRSVRDGLRASCGFPSRGATSARQRTIGQCWARQCSASGHGEIFISPVLSESLEVLGVLLHEMIHDVVGCEHGHKAPFRRLAVAVGLAGKMTATTIGEALARRLNAIASRLGEYPHGRLAVSGQLKKQGTRLLKCECPSCGYLARVTRQWIDVGALTCPCGEALQEQVGE